MARKRVKARSAKSAAKKGGGKRKAVKMVLQKPTMLPRTRRKNKRSIDYGLRPSMILGL